MSGAINQLRSVNVGLGGSLTVTESPSSLFGFLAGTGNCETDSPGVVSVTGGVTPYTYLWVYVSGSTDINPYTGTSPSTYFYAPVNAKSDILAVWKCQVTDSASTVVNSPNVSIELEGSGYSGGTGGQLP